MKTELAVSDELAKSVGVESRGLIDRVAKALFEATPFRSTEGPYDAQTESYRRMCRALAAAAIRAMRESDAVKEGF